MEGSGKEPKEEGKDLAESTEKHRYRLAMFLVGGFMVILVIDMIGGYTDPAVFAGIFSGWIVAIIGFYFLQQASDHAQQQATIITSKAERKSADISETSQEKADLIAKKATKTIEKLEMQKKDSESFVEGYREKISELISEGEEVSRGGMKEAMITASNAEKRQKISKELEKLDEEFESIKLQSKSTASDGIVDIVAVADQAKKEIRRLEKL
jgi:hypothetical protein